MNPHAGAEPVIVVMAAVIEQDGLVLVTRRVGDIHLSGFWEFPGGKVEGGESHDACLRRELAEELGVEATVGTLILTTEHAYPDRTVRLYFHRCEIKGDPSPQLGQAMRWVTRDELGSLDFPEADRALIETLRSAGQTDDAGRDEARGHRDRDGR